MVGSFRGRRSLIAIPPARDGIARVQLTSLDQNQLPLAIPSPFEFAAGFHLDAGSGPVLKFPTVRAGPAGVSPGTEVVFYRPSPFRLHWRRSRRLVAGGHGLRHGRALLRARRCGLPAPSSPGITWWRSSTGQPEHPVATVPDSPPSLITRGFLLTTQCGAARRCVQASASACKRGEEVGHDVVLVSCRTQLIFNLITGSGIHDVSIVELGLAKLLGSTTAQVEVPQGGLTTVTTRISNATLSNTHPSGPPRITRRGWTLPQQSRRIGTLRRSGRRSLPLREQSELGSSINDLSVTFAAGLQRIVVSGAATSALRAELKVRCRGHCRGHRDHHGHARAGLYTPTATSGPEIACQQFSSPSTRRRGRVRRASDGGQARVIDATDLQLIARIPVTPSTMVFRSSRAAAVTPDGTRCMSYWGGQGLALVMRWHCSRST